MDVFKKNLKKNLQKGITKDVLLSCIEEANKLHALNKSREGRTTVVSLVTRPHR